MINIVGVPKEIKKLEGRVGLTPNSVKQIVEGGKQVIVETNAGEGSYFSDQEYIDAGATIVPTANQVWEQADLVIKVKEPQESEFQFLRSDLVLFTYLHLAAYPKVAKACLESGVTAIAYETVEVNNELPLLKPMSIIAGRIAAQEAAHYLMRPYGGRGLLLGGMENISNAQVLVIGAGNVGHNAAEVALGLGADVTLVDMNQSILDECVKKYEYFSNQLTVSSDTTYVEKNISNFDIVIGAVLVPGDRAKKVVTKEMVSTMKKGSVVVDVAIDQGGCIETSRETSHDSPIFEVDGVVHYAVGNMPGGVPRTSTLALNNATISFVKKLAFEGVSGFASSSEGVKQGINVMGGKIVNETLKSFL